MSLRILIASDKFKGTLASRDVIHSLATSIQAVYPHVWLDHCILSDGGEGFLEAINQVESLNFQKVPTTDPLGRSIDGQLGISADHTIYIESSQTTGIHLLASQEKKPMKTSSSGLATLLKAALKLNPPQIYVGLGSSSTCDAGLPLAIGMGYHFYNAQNQELNDFPRQMGDIYRYTRPKQIYPPITAVVDVNNPPLGAQGGVRVYSPQKGATPAMVKQLEKGMTHLIQAVSPHLYNLAGGGAAGCLGLGLHLFLKADIIAGSPFMFEKLDLQARIQKADVIITGEGAFDEQSLFGKIPGEVVKAAHQAGKRILIVTGKKGIPEPLIPWVNASFSIEELVENRQIQNLKESQKGVTIIGNMIGTQLEKMMPSL